MKNLTFLFVLCFFLSSSFAQEATKFSSISGEINFSSARIVAEESGTEGGNVLRFAPWFNIQMYNNIDYKNYGFFYGFTVRNVGFIYKKDNERWIVRNYALGIPLGIKWGNTNGTFMYFGYEFEMPINYRERYYRNDSKERVFNVWFSDRANQFTHSGFLGFNFKNGFNVKFKYYFTEFLDPGFDNSAIDDTRDLRYPGNGLDVNDVNYIAPRETLKVNVVYISVTWNMFKKPYYYTHIEKKEKADAVY